MWLLIPFILQGVAIGIDEIWFHLKRGLPRWERIGHPIDTVTVLFCLAYVLLVPYSKEAILPYALLATLSCFMVTKDEFVHKEHCPASEQWLHALLFILHPIALLSAAFLWPISQGIETTSWLSPLLEKQNIFRLFLIGEISSMGLFMAYQIIFWNLIYDQQ